MFKWLGTASQELFDCTDFELFTWPVGFNGLSARAFSENKKEGLLYVGGTGEVYTFDGSAFTLFAEDINHDDNSGNSIVWSIAFYKDEVVIAGQFGYVEGVQAIGTARYHEDPETGIFAWEQLGQGLGLSNITKRVQQIKVINDILFAVGRFVDDGDGEELIGVAYYDDAADKWKPAHINQDELTASSTYTTGLTSFSGKLTGGQ